MKILEVAVPDETAAKIEQAAQQRGVSVEELVRRSVEEKLTRDAQFEKASRHVLTKNTELYERLS